MALCHKSPPYIPIPTNVAPRRSPKAAMPKVMLTGDRPTGPLHLGHLFGSLTERVRLQDDPEVTCYVLLADAQAYTDHADRPETVRENVTQVMFDYLAVGIDPARTTIYVQTGVPEIHELAIYFANLVTVSRLASNPTVKAEIDQKGMGALVPAGFFIYPIHQAADICVVKGELVPVGDDQKPMIELTADIARRFNSTYDDVFPIPAAVTPRGGRLPGIDGLGKAGKTTGNAIFLSDPVDVVAKKVKAMYTDPRKTSLAAPGHVDGHVPFAYLDAFATDTAKVSDLKEQYQVGGLGDGDIKRYLVDVLEDVLAPIRRRRTDFARDPGEVIALLQAGTQRTRERAAEVLAETRAAMRLDYFSSPA
jgi:tryptophanyl-tRNA synthetase